MTVKHEVTAEEKQILKRVQETPPFAQDSIALYKHKTPMDPRKRPKSVSSHPKASKTARTSDETTSSQMYDIFDIMLSSQSEMG